MIDNLKYYLVQSRVYIVLFFITCFCSYNNTTLSQVICTAQDSSGSAYSVFKNAGFDYEDPDCEHADFGPHVTQGFDGELGKNVFIFHSHIEADNDRCQVLDRVRMELKGGPGTDLELQHIENDTSYYRWKFRIDKEFLGASSFNHIYQNKAKGGNDDGFPVLTLTLRSDRLELRHNAGDTGQSLGVLTQVDLSEIRGQWVEAYIMQVHSEQGRIEFYLRSMETGLILMEHTQDNIDLWRVGAEYNRPKWGMYRLKNVILRDEEIRFADFCISEKDSTLCPSNAILITDTIAPSIPLDLRKGRTFIRSVELLWEPSTDAFGVSHYQVIQDGIVLEETQETHYNITGLDPATLYTFTIRAIDDAGNASEQSNALMIMTYAEDALPLPATNPVPVDLSTDIPNSLMLQWDQPDNTLAYNIYLGIDTIPSLVHTQQVNRLDTVLLPETTYYWRVGSLNDNGETMSDMWRFKTSDANPDAPWLVYRAEGKPHIETNFYELNEAPQLPLLDELQDDPNGSNNTYYAYRSDTNDKYRWRHNFLTGDSVITIVARLQAASSDVTGITHFEIRANGWREKVRINRSTIKMERSADIEVEHGLDLINEMHVFRIISDGKTTVMYIDESRSPLVIGESNTPDSGTYFEWGKSGGSDYGAIIDWIIIDKSGAYAPEEGTPLPDDLFLSSIASLSDILIDDLTISGFSPNQLSYSIDIIDNQVPEVSWMTTSHLAEVAATIPTTVADSTATLVVTAEDGYTEMTYSIDFLSSSSVLENNNDFIKIFPNPVKEALHVSLLDGSVRRAKILSIDGRIVIDNISVAGDTDIDLSFLIAGEYILSITDEDNKNLNYRINKN